MFGLAKAQNADALARMNQDEYYKGESWYEVATGVPLHRLVSAAVFAFYLLAPRASSASSPACPFGT